MKSLLVSLLLIPFVGLQAGRPFSDLIPGNSLLVFQMPNLPGFTAKWEASPLGKALAAYDWKALALTLAAMDDEESDLQLTRREIEKFATRWGEWTAHMNGQVVFVVGNPAEVTALMAQQKPIKEKLYENIDWDKEGEDPEFEAANRKEMLMDAEVAQATAKLFLFMAEVRDGDALLDKLAGWMRESIQEQDADEISVELITHDWDGRNVYSLAAKPEEDADEHDKKLAALEPQPWWTVADGVFFMTFSEAGLKEALARQKNPPTTNLSALPAYGESARSIGEHDVMLFINLPILDAVVRGAVEATPADPSAPVTPKAFLDWLGLDGLLPYVLGLRLADNGIHTRARFGFSRETGLSRLLVEPNDQPAPRPPFLHRNMLQATTLRWGLGRFYESLERELTLLSPQLSAGLGMGRALAAGQLGFDLKLQFLDHLGAGLVFVQDIDTTVLARMLDLAQKLETPEDMEAMMAFQRQNPTNGQYYLIGFELKNPAAVTGALNTLIAKAHPQGAPAPEEYKGQSLHFPLPDMGQMGPSTRLISYTILDNYLLVAIGNPSLLRLAVDASQDPAQRLWESEAFKALERHLAVTAESITFSSGREQESAMAILHRSLGMMMGLQGGGELPDLSAFGRAIRASIGGITRKALAFELRGFISYGEGD